MVCVHVYVVVHICLFEGLSKGLHINRNSVKWNYGRLFFTFIGFIVYRECVVSVISFL